MSDSDIQKAHDAVKSKIADNGHAVKMLHRLAGFMRDIAAKPSPADRKRLTDAGVKVRMLKTKPVGSCFQGYTFISNMRGESEGEMNEEDSAILEKNGRRFFAVNLASYEMTDYFARREVDDMNAYIDGFLRTVDITKDMATHGITLAFAEAIVCFHSGGYSGWIVFEAPKNSTTWHIHLESMLPKNRYSKKDISIINAQNKLLVEGVTKRLDALHAKGIIFSFAGSRWLDRSSVVISGDDVFLLNYVSARRASKLINEGKERDAGIIARIRGHASDFERGNMIDDLIAMDMKKLLVK